MVAKKKCVINVCVLARMQFTSYSRKRVVRLQTLMLTWWSAASYNLHALSFISASSLSLFLSQWLQIHPISEGSFRFSFWDFLCIHYFEQTLGRNIATSWWWCWYWHKRIVWKVGKTFAMMEQRYFSFTVFTVCVVLKRINYPELKYISVWHVSQA